MKTKITSYYFDLDKYEEREAWRKLCNDMDAQGIKKSVFTYKYNHSYAKALEGKECVVEEEFLFDDQWNLSISGAQGIRANDFVHYATPNRKIATGYYLDVTEEMKAARAARHSCRYCGKQYTLEGGMWLSMDGRYSAAKVGERHICTACKGSSNMLRTDYDKLVLRRITDTLQGFQVTREQHDYIESMMRSGYFLREENRAQVKEHEGEEVLRCAKLRVTVLEWCKEKGFAPSSVYTHTGENWKFGLFDSIPEAAKETMHDLLKDFPAEYTLCIAGNVEVSDRRKGV